MKAHEILEEAADKIATNKSILIWGGEGKQGGDISDELALMLSVEADDVRDGWENQYAPQLLSIAEKITGKKAEHS